MNQIGGIIMANWCENRVEIYGKPEDIKSFRKDAFKNNIFQFNNLIPRPKELEDTIAPRDTPNWYDWSIDNWGVKWDIEAEDYADDDDSIRMNFVTAWGPPSGVYNHIAENYPKLDITWFYDEPGMEIAGYLPD